MVSNEDFDILVEDIKADHAILDRLVAERKKQMTQAEMADRLCVSLYAVSSFESEMSKPKLYMIRKYARVLGLKLTVEIHRQ